MHTLATTFLARHQLGTALFWNQHRLFEIIVRLCGESPLRAPHSVVILAIVSLESMDKLLKVSADPVNSIAWLRT